MLAVADTSACALREGLVCWGGLPGGVVRPLPHVLSPLEGAEIHAGLRHYCFVGRDARVRCVGDNWHGELGTAPPPTGRPGHSLDPLLVADLVASTMATGEFHSCAVTDDGAVVCWGKNDRGQAGEPPSDSSMPVEVPLPEPIRTVGAGSEHSCAVGVGGGVWCWGSDDGGQLGDGPDVVPGFRRVLADEPMVAVRGGLTSTCALAASGQVYCWGDNRHGELGRRDLDQSDVPVLIRGLPPMRTISMGLITVCAISAADELWCWGAEVTPDADEDLWRDFRFAPERIRKAGRVQEVAVGKLATVCVTRVDDTVWCWGGSGGTELGDGTSERSSDPIQVQLPR